MTNKKLDGKEEWSRNNPHHWHEIFVSGFVVRRKFCRFDVLCVFSLRHVYVAIYGTRNRARGTVSFFFFVFCWTWLAASPVSSRLGSRVVCVCAALRTALAGGEVCVSVCAGLRKPHGMDSCPSSRANSSFEAVRRAVCVLPSDRNGLLKVTSGTLSLGRWALSRMKQVPRTR